MAGVPGFEPGLSVLETDVLTVDTIPLRGYCQLPISNCQFCNPPQACRKSAIANWQLAISFGLFMTCVLATTATEFAEFQPVRRGLLILGRHVVPTLTILTLKHNVIAWHKLFPTSDCQLIHCQFPIANCQFSKRGLFLQIGNRQLAIGNDIGNTIIRPPLKPCLLPPCVRLHE
jgi:hypothetical protein